MKTKIKWIDRCLVESPYYIGLCLNKKDFEKEMVRLKVKKSERPEWIVAGKDGKVHEFAEGKKRILIICMRKPKSKIEGIGLLVHEAVHAWQLIKAELNESRPSLEFEAYSIQTIAQRLIDGYIKL